MIREFRLPDLGEGLTESEIVTWHVAEGDTVAQDQAIAEVETAKAVVELPSPWAGVVHTLHVAAGTVVDVGSPIVTFRTDEDAESDEDAGSDAPPNDAAPDDAPTGDLPPDQPEDDDDAPPPNLVGYGATATARGPATRRARRFAEQEPVPEGEQEPAQPAEPPPGLSTAPPTRSTPPVRALAERLGVSIDALEGSGEDGRVTREDVEGAGQTAPRPASSSSTDTDTGTGTGTDERVPVRGLQKHMAQAMVAAASVPQVTVFLTVDTTATVDLLARLRARREHAEVRLTFLAAVARAVCLAVARHPGVNARWAGEEIVRSSRVDLGIAAATPRGLVVPFLTDVGGASLIDLAVGITDLAATARAGRTTPAAMEGGTLTISNVGVFGVDAGTPILHRGQAVILAVGAVNRRPWEHDGALALRHVVTLSLTLDHRVLDGEQGARFLAAVGATLTDPASAFVG